MFQAGDSDQGRDLGARIGDGIFTHAPNFEAGVAFYSDIKSRAAAYGRSPEDIVVLPGVSVTVGDTDTDAREIERSTQLADNDFGKSLRELGRPFGWHDFNRYDLDAPFPSEALQYAERSFYTQAKKITELAADRGLTLRQTVELLNAPKLSPFTGGAETVANELQRWLDGHALDGINIHIGHPAQFGRFLDEVLPILRERGVVREEYEHNTLRGNLGLPFAENRYTRAEREGIAPAPLPGTSASLSAIV